MRVKLLAERWTIIGLSVLMVLALAMLAHGLVRNSDSAERLGILSLDRAAENQRQQFGLLTGTFIWDVEEQASWAYAHAEPSDTSLIHQWLPLLESRYAIDGIGLANDRGDEQRLQRVDSSWLFTHSIRSMLPAAGTLRKWPLRRTWSVPPPQEAGSSDDPREAIWFSQALEAQHDQPVWSVTEGLQGAPATTIHLSLLIRSRSDAHAYRVLHLDLNAEAMLKGNLHWTQAISTAQFSAKGRPLVPLDTTAIDKAWASALADWEVDRPNTTFEREVAGQKWLGRIMPFVLNGTTFNIGTMVALDPIERWTSEGRTALWWVLGLLILLALLMSMVYLRGRDAEKRVQRQERRTRVQAGHLAKAIDERAVLDREVHHRVKNNLQVVSSLLNLQAQRIPLQQARDEFIRGKRRIDSMALVHHKLYRQPDLDSVDLRQFLDDLAKAMSSMFEPDSRSVSHHVDTDGIRSNADTSIQLGMILCELLANCHQHAFPYATGGHIEITVRDMGNGQFSMTVKDNGKGLEPDSASSAHLGLEVVAALAEQLDGTLQTEQKEGTLVTVTFRAQNRG